MIKSVARPIITHKYISKAQYGNDIHTLMYGLKQSGKISNDDIIKYLKEFGYYLSRKTPGMWLHKTRKISFTLVVDDLGVKYIDKADPDHLFSAIEAKYPLQIDWESSTYLGINVEWHYDEGYFILTMK